MYAVFVKVRYFFGTIKDIVILNSGFINPEFVFENNVIKQISL